jgi:hypothetical protein
VPIKAVNMIKTGERYGYAHYLCSEHFYVQGVGILHMDIQCKYKPWEAAANAKVLQCTAEEVINSACQHRVQRTHAAASSTVKVLSEAHGLLHDINCQVCSTAVVQYVSCSHHVHDQLTMCLCRFSMGPAGWKAQQQEQVRMQSSSSQRCLGWLLQQRSWGQLGAQRR